MGLAEMGASPESLSLETPIYLVSSDLPGSGSTTVAELLAARVASYTERDDTYMVSIGAEIRKKMALASEADLHTSEKAGAVPHDPHAFDLQFYEEALHHNIAVVEGKKATTVGADLIGLRRPIVTVDLSSSPFNSAVRVMRREGIDLAGIIRDPGALFPYVMKILDRASYLKKLGSDAPEAVRAPAYRSYTFDSAGLLPEEIVGQITGNRPWESRAPQWEFSALRTMVTRLVALDMTLKIPSLDHAHFAHNFERLKYQIETLENNNNPYALASVRENIRTAYTNAVFALLIKAMPRFFRDPQGNPVSDKISHQWTPEYYKLANMWPTLKVFLKDKTVLDPFAGAGTFMSLLAARGVPKRVTYADISYPGGQKLNGSDFVYDPAMNVAMLAMLFDELPSWYKPHCAQVIAGNVTANAIQLPFADNSFDLIAGDPPYGKNLKDGDYELFLKMLPELNRVAREGGIFMVPDMWTPRIANSGYWYEQLTSDLSQGRSNFPVSAVYIPKQV